VSDEGVSARFPGGSIWLQSVSGCSNKRLADRVLELYRKALAIDLTSGSARENIERVLSNDTE